MQIRKDDERVVAVAARVTGVEPQRIGVELDRGVVVIELPNTMALGDERKRMQAEIAVELGIERVSFV